MSKQTPLLLKPSLDEVKLQAAKIGLPEDEAESFFYYYSSQGWKVGKVPMKCWLSAIRGWQVRWRQRHARTNTVVFQREYERVLQRIASIRASYEPHQRMDARDAAEFKLLKARAEQLKKILGVML